MIKLTYQRKRGNYMLSTKERDKQIISEYRKGKSFTTLSKEYPVSRQYIQKICTHATYHKSFIGAFCFLWECFENQMVLEEEEEREVENLLKLGHLSIAEVRYLHEISFSDFLKENGYSVGDFSNISDASLKTVYRWKSENNIPSNYYCLLMLIFSNRALRTKFCSYEVSDSYSLPVLLSGFNLSYLAFSQCFRIPVTTAMQWGMSGVEIPKRVRKILSFFYDEHIFAMFG